jgi:hypothetical protein
MKSLTIDTIYEPLYLTGLLASTILLGVIRRAEPAAEKTPKYQRFVPIAGGLRTARPLRVRIGETPILAWGKPNTARFFSPTFLYGEIFLREPMAILPFAATWIAVVVGEPVVGAAMAAFGLLWRAGADWLLLPPHWSADERRLSILLKWCFCVATGVYVASLIILAWSFFLMLCILFALIAGGSGSRRKSKY